MGDVVDVGRIYSSLLSRDVFLCSCGINLVKSNNDTTLSCVMFISTAGRVLMAQSDFGWRIVRAV